MYIRSNIFHEAKLGNHRRSAGSFPALTWLIRFEISISLTGKQKANKFEVFVGKHDGERVEAVSCPRGTRLAHGVVPGAREGKRVVQLPRSLTDKLTYANTASLRPVI